MLIQIGIQNPGGKPCTWIEPSGFDCCVPISSRAGKYLLYHAELSEIQFLNIGRVRDLWFYMWQNLLWLKPGIVDQKKFWPRKSSIRATDYNPVPFEAKLV